MENVGKRLKSLREKYKFSLEEVAKKIKSSAGAISRYENNERKINSESLIKLSNLYNVSPEYILYGTKKNSSNLESDIISFFHNENIDIEKKEELLAKADKVVFTGMIDQYFDYKFGVLEYRSLRFEHETLDEENHQGNAVVNYNEREVPYTRIIEHKHFEFGKQPKTVITREYPAEWKQGDEPYYPVNNDKNAEIFKKYQELAKQEKNVIFGGRLANYKYYDMHHVFEVALEVVEEEFGGM